MATQYVLITGNTYPVKDKLRAMGGHWDADRGGWLVPANRAEEAKSLVGVTAAVPQADTSQRAVEVRARVAAALKKLTKLTRRILIRDLSWDDRVGDLREDFLFSSTELKQVARETGVRLRWLTHGNGPMQATQEWLSIPVVTQACQDLNLIPLGSIYAESDWIDNDEQRFQSLVVKIRDAAPTGTTRIYNLVYQVKEYHGHLYYVGTADAYMSPQPVPMVAGTPLLHGRKIGKLRRRKKPK